MTDSDIYPWERASGSQRAQHMAAECGRRIAYHAACLQNATTREQRRDRMAAASKWARALEAIADAVEAETFAP